MTIEYIMESFIDRMVFVVLRSKTSPVYDIVVVSWHGRYKIGTDKKIKLTGILFRALVQYANEKNIRYIICGGDFNVDRRYSQISNEHFIELYYDLTRREKTDNLFDYIFVNGNVSNVSTISIDPTTAIQNAYTLRLSKSETMNVRDHDPIYSLVELIPRPFSQNEYEILCFHTI